VRKKCGGLRFVLTRGDLMQSPTGMFFAIPRIDDLLDQLSGKKVPVSTLDAKSGYWKNSNGPQVQWRKQHLSHRGDSTSSMRCPLGMQAI